jgi:hypothetical protein
MLFPLPGKFRDSAVVDSQSPEEGLETVPPQIRFLCRDTNQLAERWDLEPTYPKAISIVIDKK